MDVSRLYKNTENFVMNLFAEHVKPDLIFHNIDHTRSVVERTKEIAGHYALSEEDMLAAYIAAWFHDTGYLFTDAARHEQKSVKLMKKFMAVNKFGSALTDKIEACILATRPPLSFDTLIKQIICDADTYHFGTKEFKITNKKVWKEFKMHGHKSTEREWAQQTIKLLNRHKFHTQYCQMLLENGKQKNIRMIEKIVNPNKNISHLKEGEQKKIH